MIRQIPQRFRDDVVRRIGHGGEATVYELSGDRALRVYHGKPHGAGALAGFYRSIARGSPSFALPEVIEQGEEDGVAYSVDRLIRGRPLHELMRELQGDTRRRALASYVDAVFEIASLPYTRDVYGEFLRDEDSITAASWDAYLLARMQRSLDAAPWLADDVPALASVVHALAQRIRAFPRPAKALVHGDYFPGNVLITDDLRVAGVIDFGPLTVVGDPRLDHASAVMFLEVARPGYTPDDTDFCLQRLLARADEPTRDDIATYRAWYAIRFSPYRADDARLYAWCVRSLRAASDNFRV
jgi:aminoglycoside phosphotransferase (APT) family kinase protein